MASQADRNLLFGIFALQMDMISRDMLVQAMNAWVLRKQDTLGEVLLSLDAMARYDIDLINQLVDRNVARHSGDASLALAALPVSHSEIHALQTITDEDVLTSIQRLPGGTEPFRSTAAKAEVPATPSAVRFHDIQFHAEGGLGEVWKARDDELGRQVALKRIKPRFGHDEESQVRFVWEAEITGNLEHPGIVPVYGFGRYADGRPYYAMRFIRGDSLKREIEKFHRSTESTPAEPGSEGNEFRSTIELKKAPSMTQHDESRSTDGISPHNLKFRRLIKCLIDACNTIHFAHTEGVLHRDIKPANIMLGDFGETLVVDWGLAKKMNAPEKLASDRLPTIRRSNTGESTATQMGSAMGTPAYMSPEQAAGRWDRVGVESDIYSLGASLYHVLVGDTPIREKEITRLLNRVESGDFPPPRDVNPAIPKQLSAICMKAMALKPIDRYKSARDLGDDLERWLADAEVAAYPESRREQAARWIRHNSAKAYTIAAAALAVLLAVAAAAVATGIAGRQRSLALARLQAEREAVDAYLGQASESLKYYDGAQQTREDMLVVAAQHYERIIEEEGSTDELQRELAHTFLRLGDVQKHRGKTAEARGAFQRAQTGLAELVKDNPTTADKALWGQSRIRLALLLWDEKLPDEAIGALAAVRREMEGDEAELKDVRGNCLTNEGSILLSSRRLTEARTRLQEATALCKELAHATQRGKTIQEMTTFAERLRALANANALHGHCLAQLGQLREGREQVEDAVRQFAQLVEMRSHPAYLEELAATRIVLCDVLRRQADYPAAAAQYQLAIENYERLVSLLPDVPMIRERLAVARVNAAQSLNEQARFEDALQELQTAAPMFPEVERQRASFADFQLGFAALMDALGEVLRETGPQEKHAEALQSYHNAQEYLGKALAHSPQEAGERLAIMQSHEAQLLELQGNDADAEKLYREALAGLENVAADSLTAQDAQALIHTYLGDLLLRRRAGDAPRRAGDAPRRVGDVNPPVEPATHYRQAIQIWTKLSQQPEPSPVALQRFAWFLANCRDASLRDPPAAQTHIDKAVKLAPSDPALLFTQALVHFRLGRHHESVDILNGLAESPEAAAWQGHVQSLLAMNRWQQEEQDNARELLDKSLQWRVEHRPGNRLLAELSDDAKALIFSAKSPEIPQP